VDAVQIRLDFDESESLLRQMREAGWICSIQTDMPTRSHCGRKMRVSVDGWILLVTPDVLQLASIFRFVHLQPGHRQSN